MRQRDLSVRNSVLPFVEPKRAFEKILNYPIAERELVLAAALIACVAAAASGSIYVLVEATPGSTLSPMEPIIEAILNFVIIMGGAALIRRIGGVFGGYGQRIACMKAMIWWSWFSIVPNLILSYAVQAGIDVGVLIWMVLNVILFLFFGRFVQIVHGFESFVLTLLGIFVTGFIFIAMLFVALGIAGL